MNETKEKIFRTAKRLFEKQGYFNTTIREIAKDADVNLGLFSYYFKSKYNLAVSIYDEIFYNIKSFTEDYFGYLENPAVFMGIMMRMHTYTLGDERGILFAVDALKEGIFEESMVPLSMPLLANINAYYKTGLSAEDQKLVLFITLGVERSLITNNFKKNINLEIATMADCILRVHLFHLGLDSDQVKWCLQKVNKHFDKLLAERPNFIDNMINHRS